MTFTFATQYATQEQLMVVEGSKLCDLKAENFLFHSIDRSIMEIILVRNTKYNWDDMRPKYHGSSKVKKTHLEALKILRFLQ